MKNISLLMVLLFACSVHAQKDVTTFIGIPIDGYKSEMKKKLIAKGFTPTKQVGQDFLEGEFNGFDVRLYIVTNNNKVYRIMLADANTQDEANIKIRFNKLVDQFKNNKRYVCLDNYELSESEDISYETTVNNKTYDALFYQNLDMEKVDTIAMQAQIKEELLKDFTEDQLNNPTEEIKNALQKKALSIGFVDMISKKVVWFRICKLYSQYYITMYYDNEYNHANGEDL